MVNQKNVILVTDDIKEDWWIKTDSFKFRTELLEEFKETTSKSKGTAELQLIPFVSEHFFDSMADSYGYDRLDAIDIAMSLTDDDYISAIQDKVFDCILIKLVCSGEEYLDLDSLTNIGSEGITDWDVEDYEYKDYEFYERVGDQVTYILKYSVTLYGTSHDYWGRDDDTKECNYSPDYCHTVEGDIYVKVTRTVDMFVDFNEADEFDNCEIIDGNLKEIEYRSKAEEETSEEIFNTCPRCGRSITYANDAGNGFCIECTLESDDI